jgi:hypothetical protein
MMGMATPLLETKLYIPRGGAAWCCVHGSSSA